MKSRWMEVLVLNEDYDELRGYYEGVDESKWKKDKGDGRLPDVLGSIDELFALYVQVKIVAGQFEATGKESEGF